MAMVSQQSVLVLVASLAVLLTGAAADSIDKFPSFPSFPGFPCFGLAGKADCDHNIKNGCETDLYTDEKNCGGCGEVCKDKYGYKTVCKGGHCEYDCKDGYADCNHYPKDGCETYIGGDDVKNCGGCDVVCDEKAGFDTSCKDGTCVYVDICTVKEIKCPSYPYAVSVCKGGKCVATCYPGYADCNNKLDDKDGCEVNVYTDVYNCGKCGAKCEVYPGYDTSCKDGKCVYVDKCNKIECPYYAYADTSCKEGKCMATCSPGYADCNKDLKKDGCEVSLYTDVYNCGKCGAKCDDKPGYYSTCEHGKCVHVDMCTKVDCPKYHNADPSCYEGKCMATCSPGYADCNGNMKDGCEANMFNDKNNCGKCGNMCSKFSLCLKGACKPF